VGFKKPPVVEAWIEFRFALTQEDSKWDEDAARNLMKKYSGEFVAGSFLKCLQINVNVGPDQPHLAEKQESFERVRAFSEGGDHCIQAGRDVFVFNQLKRTTWLGYESMCDAAVAAVGKYMLFRGLNELTRVSLHYRDVVSIPKGAISGIDFSKWFRVYPQIPADSFGGVSAFTFAVHLPAMCEDATAILSVQNLPSPAEDSEFRFSIDWHANSVHSLESLEAARKWLDRTHSTLRSSFEKAFTSQCLALFEPSEGD
jgi:uncharacterized protein (TIGR04255 family)